MDAFIYIRWSSTEQTKGSSLARQREICRKHCAAKGWRVVDELRDEGLSAWTGENAEEGALAAFIERVKLGEFPNGVILVVEQLDRLSRRPVIDMFDWLRGTVALGIRIATAIGDGFFEANSFDLTTIIRIAVEADLAHRQSQDKSTKLAASWADKRAKQQAGKLAVITKRAPGWLKVEGSPPAFVLIEDRAAIVRRIFEETAAGYGKASIARRLNEEGIATFGRGAGWHNTYIQKILNSPTVLGEMQPGRKPRGKPRELIGDPIRNYYPPVIDAELYARARRSMAGRSRQVAGKGRKLVNIFSGIAKCGACGSRMTFRGKGEKVRANGERVNEDYLVCDNFQRGRGCQVGHHFHYGAWQTAVLNAVLSKALSDEHFASPAEVRALQIEHAEFTRRRDEARLGAERAMQLFLLKGDAEAQFTYGRLIDTAKECEHTLEGLANRIVAARGAVSPAEHQKRIESLFYEMDADDPETRFQARSRVMEAVHELVSSMMYHKNPARIDVSLKAGQGATIECVGGSGPDMEFYYRYEHGFF